MRYTVCDILLRKQVSHGSQVLFKQKEKKRKISTLQITLKYDLFSKESIISTQNLKFIKRQGIQVSDERRTEERDL